MKKYLRTLLAALFACTTCIGCAHTDTSSPDSASETKNTYEQITPAAAKALMDSEDNYIILDVRTTEEFSAGHIAGAILLPDFEIAARAERVLPDRGQLILVYCRSGRRSKNAASELAAMGYTKVKEFGGIIDWPYGTVTE